MKWVLHQERKTMILNKILISAFLLLLMVQCKAQNVCTTWKLYTTETVRNNLGQFSLSVKDEFCDTGVGDALKLFNKHTISKTDLLSFTNDSNHNGEFNNYTLHRLGKYKITYAKREIELLLINIDYNAGSGLYSYLIFFSNDLGVVMKSYPIEYNQLYYFISKRCFLGRKTSYNDHMDYGKLQEAILEVFHPL